MKIIDDDYLSDDSWASKYDTGNNQAPAKKVKGADEPELCLPVFDDKVYDPDKIMDAVRNSCGGHTAKR